MMASISVTPSERAASTIRPKSSSSLSGISAPDFDLSEARRAGAVPGPHHLFRLPLAAIRNAPQVPVRAPGDGIASVPELRRNAAIARVLEHADAFAVADLPARLAAELEVVALVVNGPAPVGFHVDAVIHIEHFLQRLLARQEAHIGQDRKSTRLNSSH